MEEKLTKDERKRQRQLERLANHDSGGSDMMKWIILAVGAIVFVAFFGTIIFLIKQNQNKPVTLSSTGYVRGSGPVTLIEFGDLQCPACKAYEPLVQQLSKEYKGKVKLVFKHFPLTSVHQNALLAAKVTVAADKQGKFWEMHDWMYENQDTWALLSGSEAKDKMLVEAEKLKLDMDKFKKDIDSSETAKTISEMQNEGIEVGVAGTPTFFLDNKKLDTPADYEALKKVIDQELAKK